MKRRILENQDDSSRVDTKDPCSVQRGPVPIEDGCSPRDGVVIEQDDDRMRGIPICVEDGLYLQPSNACDGRRFASLFARVWSRIPDADRKSILGYWQQEDEWWDSPTIEIVDLIVDGVETDRLDIECGQQEIKFNSALVNELSDLETETMIAFRLAMIKWGIDFAYLVIHCFGRRFDHRDTTELVREWGYDLDDLLIQHRRRMIV